MAVSQQLIDRLNKLLMLDHDAVEAYQQAIDRMDSATCRNKLGEFQNDHRRHIDELKKCIAQFGGTPKDRTDVKGFFIKGMTSLQSMMGDEMALKAMQTNEKLTNRTYQDALDDLQMPEDIRLLVQKNRDDERRHLQWIEMALQQRLWEQDRPGTSA